MFQDMSRDDIRQNNKIECEFLFCSQCNHGDLTPMLGETSIQAWEARHTKQHEGSDGHGILGLDPQRRMSFLQECYLSHVYVYVQQGPVIGCFNIA